MSEQEIVSNDHDELDGADEDEQTDHLTADSPDVSDGTPETFPRAYVEKLRQEAANARVKAKRSDQLADRLLDATISLALSGRLADPADLLRHVEDATTLLDDDGLPDRGKISTMADQILADRPHLASRTPRGDIDQGRRGGEPRVDLSSVLRRLAG